MNELLLYIYSALPWDIEQKCIRKLNEFETVFVRLSDIKMTDNNVIFQRTAVQDKHYKCLTKVDKYFTKVKSNKM